MSSTDARSPAAASPAGLTAELARRAGATRFDALPGEVVELARQCLLDWLGVTLAGAGEPAVGILLDEVDEGPATVVGHRRGAGVLDAALVNGTGSHALDYDDVNQAMFGHPSVPIMAGLLAQAESVGARGADLVTAFVAGYELECSLGRALGVEHYRRGFHTTATAGTFGAAAACSRLMASAPSVLEQALGIAATQAAGLKSMFGTMCKPLHAGAASRAGLLAARLAARGFTSAPAAVETEQGFAATHSQSFEAARGLQEPAGGWHLLSNLFKYHAACFQTHSTIEGLRRMREREGIEVSDVAEVTVHADELQLGMCNIAEPVTGLQAKFSLRQTATFALAGLDTASADTYSEATVARPELIRLRSAVVVVPDGQPGPTRVDVVLRDGRRLSAAHDVSVPESDLALQRRRLEAKFAALATPVVGGDAAAALLEAVGRLEDLDDVRPLLALTRPA
ncbi:MAG TPA: MmgE/PrpD family protein [Acidimicrobiales bacterium]|nr:MmgE/PrpD family protein [Acidimicrobiales bacterium]